MISSADLSCEESDDCIPCFDEEVANESIRLVLMFSSGAELLLRNAADGMDGCFDE